MLQVLKPTQRNFVSKKIKPCDFVWQLRNDEFSKNEGLSEAAKKNTVKDIVIPARIFKIMCFCAKLCD